LIEEEPHQQRALRPLELDVEKCSEKKTSRYIKLCEKLSFLSFQRVFWEWVHCDDSAEGMSTKRPTEWWTLGCGYLFILSDTFDIQKRIALDVLCFQTKETASVTKQIAQGEEIEDESAKQLQKILLTCCSQAAVCCFQVKLHEKALTLKQQLLIRSNSNCIHLCMLQRGH
jgi:hypothetical protein